MDQPVTPRPAAALVLARTCTSAGFEVFMVRRHVRNEFAPDVFVFPGGSVTSADQQIELVPGLCRLVDPGLTRLGSGFRAAALRECFEEAGVLLARDGERPLAIGREAAERYAAYRTGLQRKTGNLTTLLLTEGLTLATDILIHWAHWITPEAYALRFDTHFFFAPMPAEQRAVHDEVETTEGVWIPPEDALTRYEAGTFPLVFATLHQLRALTHLGSVEQAQERLAAREPDTIMPRVVVRNGAEVILLPGQN